MTQQDDQWGPWIEHDGKGFPAPVGTMVWRVFDEPVSRLRGVNITPTQEIIEPLEARELESWLWAMPRGFYVEIIARVVKYRIRQYRSLELLKRIAEQPQPVPKGREVDA